MFFTISWMFSPSENPYLSVSLSCPLQFDIQWRKMSFPLPDTESDNGEDWDPIESVNVGDILDPSKTLLYWTIINVYDKM